MRAATGRCRPTPDVLEGMQTNFANPDAYPVDGRGVALFHGVFQRQASGDRPVLPDDDRGQGRQAARRRQHLSPERAGERAGQAVLVGDGLRPRHPCPDPRHAVGEPLFPDAGAAEERRRLGGRLLRSQSAGGQGVELGSDERRRKIRSPVPLLWPGEAAVRQDVEAAGHRESEVTE